MIRIYHGRSRDQAALTFNSDAERLALDGWEVAFQSWGPPQSGYLRTILHLWVLEFLHRPTGTLTVTYRMRDSGPRP